MYFLKLNHISVKKVFVFSIIIFLCLNTFNLNAQSQKVDSLEQQLLKHTHDDTSKVNLLNDIAWAIYANNNEKSLEYANQAGEIADKLGYTAGKAVSLNLNGVYHYVKGNYPESLDYFQKSMLLHKESDNKIGVASCLNNIGVIHQISGNFEESLQSFQESLERKKEIGDETGIPSSLNNIGTVYMDLGKLDLAKEYFEKSLGLKQKLGDKNGISASYENIGLIYKEQKNYSEALNYLYMSIDIDQELENKYDICVTYANISDVYLDMKDYTNSLKYCLKSLEIAEALEIIDIQKDMYLTLSEIYKFKYDFKKAYENYVLYKELNDSIFNEENIKKITALNYQYKFEKEKQAIELEQKKMDAVKAEEKKKLELVRNSFMFGFILMIIVVILVLQILKVRRRANRILALQKQNIEDSISYAQTIQNAILPSEREINKSFECFILFKPKDIVSGDFYWYSATKDYHFIAVVDCTGHGVPGAFMSFIGSRLLSEIIMEQHIYSTKDILTELNLKTNSILKQKNDIKDGMEVCLCRVEKRIHTKLVFSGSKRDLIWYQSNKHSIEIISGDRIPIGGKTRTKQTTEFTEKEISLENGDILYLSTDGYIDQNNADRQRLGSKKFLELIQKNATLPISKQKILLEKELDSWQQDTLQRDDITVIGIKV